MDNSQLAVACTRHYLRRSRSLLCLPLVTASVPLNTSPLTRVPGRC